jgi:hypothetical protein
VGALLVLVAAPVRAEPISFRAPPMAEPGAIVVGAGAGVDLAPNGPSPERASEVTLAARLTAAVGVGGWLTLSASGSFVHRTATLSLPGQTVDRSVAGVGDTEAIAVFRAWHSGSGAVTPFVGIEIPTGDDDAGDEHGRFPQRFQTSTGATGLVAGALATWRVGATGLDAGVSFATRPEANAFDAGDELRVELSAGRRVVPSTSWGSSALALRPVAQTRLVWQGADAGPLAPADSGGVTWALIPGLQLLAGRHLVELAVEVPIAQPADRHTAAVLRVGYRVGFASW